MAKASALSLLRISVRGVVQGVGFRPFVYQLATRHNLRGWVCNTSEDVRIEVEGIEEDLEQFTLELRELAPPLSRIEGITTAQGKPAHYQNFEIRQSVAQEGKYQLISPDIATCPACLKEVLNPSDRRYRYPFTNCTNCGPRFTIIEDIPYDRPRTTMRSFKMCPDCQREYDDPLDRRFHAQPNACPKCGPRLELLDAGGKKIDTTDVSAAASGLLKESKIIAVKGLGGFLLACDATSENAVRDLRLRKNRPFKPLAVMVTSLEEAKKYCRVNEEEAKLLTSAASPIVLLEWKSGSPISPEVAPNIKYLGLMLPYTPLHYLLLRETGLPLVMTSGNLSEEPIARENDEAVSRLAGIADYFLVHNRDIYARYDDSVTMVAGGAPRLLRRARGYAPYPVRLNFKGQQVLACGAEEKNTFCLTRDEYAFVSQHIGDMENMETMEHFQNTIALYQKLFRIKPEIIACDMHPEYLATKYAKELAEQLNVKLVPVQHHHAHIASCLADNGISGPVIGVALDGTGYGTDGNIWGGEFLLADYQWFTRMGQFEYLPLPGGTQTIRKPYRTAIAYLITHLGESALSLDIPCLKRVEPLEIQIILKQVEQKINSPLTSSCGRLFDAVSALIGVRGEIKYEAQAAIELEMVADDSETGDYPFSIAEREGVRVIGFRDMFSAILRDLELGVTQACISGKFHNTVARMITELCQAVSAKTGLKQVVLSGGVFQNRLLLGKAIISLGLGGFKVFTHRQVPCNDGGISLGQAVIANFYKEKVK